MTKDETREAIKVMQAWVDGEGDVEFKAKFAPAVPWSSAKPSWNWYKNEYRIKPKPREWVLEPMKDISPTMTAYPLGVNGYVDTSAYRKDCIRVREITDE